MALYKGRRDVKERKKKTKEALFWGHKNVFFSTLVSTWFIQDKILKALYMFASNCFPGHLITCGLWKLMGIFQHSNAPTPLLKWRGKSISLVNEGLLLFVFIDWVMHCSISKSKLVSIFCFKETERVTCRLTPQVYTQIS